MIAVDRGRTAAAMAGGLLAGVALSAVMLLGERASGKPSELIELERAAARRLGRAAPADPAPTGPAEQLATHGGHLVLSALAGLAYAATVDADDDGPASGARFGLGFFIAMYGVAGPALGVTPAPWRQPPFRAVQHPVVHVLFGLAMAGLARRARPGSSGPAAA